MTTRAIRRVFGAVTSAKSTPARWASDVSHAKQSAPPSRSCCSGSRKLASSPTSHKIHEGAGYAPFGVFFAKCRRNTLLEGLQVHQACRQQANLVAIAAHCRPVLRWPTHSCRLGTHGAGRPRSAESVWMWTCGASCAQLRIHHAAEHLTASHCTSSLYEACRPTERPSDRWRHGVSAGRSASKGSLNSRGMTRQVPGDTGARSSVTHPQLVCEWSNEPGMSPAMIAIDARHARTMQRRPGRGSSRVCWTGST